MHVAIELRDWRRKVLTHGVVLTKAMKLYQWKVGGTYERHRNSALFVAEVKLVALKLLIKAQATCFASFTIIPG